MQMLVTPLREGTTNKIYTNIPQLIQNTFCLMKTSINYLIPPGAVKQVDASPSLRDEKLFSKKHFSKKFLKDLVASIALLEGK